MQTTTQFPTNAAEFEVWMVAFRSELAQIEGDLEAERLENVALTAKVADLVRTFGALN